MEIASTTFSESIAEFTTLETQHSNFHLHAFNSAAPGDEDEDGNEKEDEDQDQGGNNSKGSDDDNPPLDKDIVHSPLIPDPGGKPK